MIVTAVPTTAELNVETPVTLRSLLVVATETPRVATVAIPVMSALVAVNSSKLRSPSIVRSPPI